jgi:hypothetical protein
MTLSSQFCIKTDPPAAAATFIHKSFKSSSLAAALTAKKTSLDRLLITWACKLYWLSRAAASYQRTFCCCDPAIDNLRKSSSHSKRMWFCSHKNPLLMTSVWYKILLCTICVYCGVYYIKIAIWHAGAHITFSKLVERSVISITIDSPHTTMYRHRRWSRRSPGWSILWSSGDLDRRIGYPGRPRIHNRKTHWSHLWSSVPRLAVAQHHLTEQAKCSATIV